MKGSTATFFTLLVALFVVFYPAAAAAECNADLPAPAAELIGFESSADADGNPLTTYRISVANWDSYPAELFEHAAELPACDAGEHNARTRVGIYDAEDDSLLQEFCDLGLSEDLADIWFSCAQEEPPLSVYVTLNDRACGLTYTSEPVPIPPQ